MSKFTICSTIRNPNVLKIEGSKGVYDLHLSTPFSDAVCSCDGFYYRGTCRHVNEQEASRCQWMIQGEAHPTGCPNCGQPTEVWETKPEFI